MLYLRRLLTLSSKMFQMVCCRLLASHVLPSARIRSQPLDGRPERSLRRRRTDPRLACRHRFTQRLAGDCHYNFQSGSLVADGAHRNEQRYQ